MMAPSVRYRTRIRNITGKGVGEGVAPPGDFAQPPGGVVVEVDKLLGGPEPTAETAVPL